MGSRQRGMTLLEVMVALALIAVVTTAGAQLLHGLVQLRGSHAQRVELLAQWQRSLHQLQRDLDQWQVAPLEHDGQGERPTLVLVDAEVLTLATAGQVSPLAPRRSALQQVRYRLGRHPERHDEASPHYQDEGRYLLREQWHAALAPVQAEPDRIRALMPAPEPFVLTVVDRRGGQHRQWPPAAADSPRPVATAVLLQLGHPRLGPLETRLPLAARRLQEAG